MSGYVWGWGDGRGVFSEDRLICRGGGGVVAQSNMTPLHIAYNGFFVLYIFSFFLISVICQHI